MHHFNPLLTNNRLLAKGEDSRVYKENNFTNLRWLTKMLAKNSLV